MQLAMIDDKVLPFKDLEPAYQDRGPGSATASMR